MDKLMFSFFAAVGFGVWQKSFMAGYFLLMLLWALDFMINRNSDKGEEDEE